MQKLLATPSLTAREDKTRGPEGSVSLVGKGVGVVIGRSDANDVTQPVTILKVAPGGSAHRSGNVSEGDELLAVDDLRCVGRTLTEISRHIIGPIGTLVEFEMKRSVQGPCWRLKLRRGGMEDAEIKEEREKEDAAEEREKQRIQNWAEKESIENWAKAMLKRKEQELHAEGGRRPLLTGALTDSLDSNVEFLPFLHSDSEAEVEDVEDDERAPPPRVPPPRLPPSAFDPAQSYQENRMRDYQNHFPTAYSREYVESAADFDASGVASEVRYFFHSLCRNGCMQSCKVQLFFFFSCSLSVSLSLSLSFPPPSSSACVCACVCLSCPFAKRVHVLCTFQVAFVFIWCGQNVCRTCLSSLATTWYMRPLDFYSVLQQTPTQFLAPM
jgi:hypothetical protein